MTNPVLYNLFLCLNKCFTHRNVISCAVYYLSTYAGFPKLVLLGVSWKLMTEMTYTSTRAAEHWDSVLKISVKQKYCVMCKMCRDGSLYFCARHLYQFCDMKAHSSLIKIWQKGLKHTASRSLNHLQSIPDSVCILICCDKQTEHTHFYVIPKMHTAQIPSLKHHAYRCQGKWPVSCFSPMQTQCNASFLILHLFSFV